MNYYLLIPFFAFVLEGFTVSYIFGQESKSPVNKAYMLMALGIVGWALSDLLIWSHDNNDVSVLVMKIASIFWLSIGFMFLNFTYRILGRKNDWILYGVGIIVLAAYGTSLCSDLVVKGYLKEVWGKQLLHGPAFMPFVFTIVTFPFLYGFYLIRNLLLNTADEHIKKQLGLVLYGTALTLVIGLVVDVVIPYGLGYVHMIQLGSSVSLIHTGFLFLSITKYKFLRIGIQEAATELFSNVKDGIVLTDSKSNIYQVNDAARKLLGLGYITDEQQDLSFIKLDDIIQGFSFDKNYADFETIVDVHGELKYLSLSVSEIQQDNLLIGKILLLKDITEAKVAAMEIREKNKKITASINYASRIQNAILSSQEYMERIFEDYFVLLKPRDIVSGDFYWVHKAPDGKVIWTVADCTGHGVPGAFMSMIGISLLNEIIIEKGINESDQILMMMKEGIIKSLKQTGDAYEANDGMEMALCVFDPKTRKLEFSGANNRLLVVGEDGYKEYKGNLESIAFTHRGDGAFCKTEILLKKSDKVYMFTDGYKDQLGGLSNERFYHASLVNLINDSSSKHMNEQRDHLVSEFNEWKGAAPQLDDICVMGVQF